MSVLRHISAKPWLSDARPAHVIHPGMAPRTSTTKGGLQLFLAVVTVLFLLISIAFLENTSLPQWTPLHEPRLLWYNTAILVLSSLTIQYAHALARKNKPERARQFLIISAVLTTVFLYAQVFAWNELLQEGFVASVNPAYAFFYLMTGLHGLHILGGVTVLILALGRISQDFSLKSVAATTRLCAIYWHYLLLVWIVLFGLLVVDNYIVNTFWYGICVG